MSNNGQIPISGSLDVRISGSLDSKGTTGTYSDLTNIERWKSSDGEAYVFKGMTTVVTDDPDPLLNGTYRLVDLPVTDIKNWAYMEGAPLEPFSILSTSVGDDGLANSVSVNSDKIQVKATTVTDINGDKVDIAETEFDLPHYKESLVVYSDTEGCQIYPTQPVLPTELVPYYLPPLTRNYAQYYTPYGVTGTRYDVDHQPWHMFDDDPTTYWSTHYTSSGVRLPITVDIGFDKVVKLHSFGILISLVGMAKDFTLQGSKTDVSGEEEWVDIQNYVVPPRTEEEASVGYATRSFTIDEENRDLYYGYRFNFTTAYANAGFLSAKSMTFVCEAYPDESINGVELHSGYKPEKYLEVTKDGVRTHKADLTTPPLAKITRGTDGTISIINYEQGTKAFKFTESETLRIKEIASDGSLSIDPDTMILKGRVDTVDLLPTTDNKNGDVWLVGLATAEAFDKYIYIEEVSRFEEITSPTLEAIVNDLISRTAILETTIEQKVNTSDISPLFEEAFAGFKKKNMLPVHLLDIDVEVSEENRLKLFNPDNKENIELIVANDGPSEDRRFTFWVCKTTNEVDYNLTRFSHFEYKYVGTYSFNIVAYAYMTKEDYENKTNPVRFVQKIEESNPYETPEEADIRIIYISEEFQSAYALEYTITSATPGSNVAFIYLGVYQQSLEVNIPVASETQLGGVKVGYGLDITPDGALYVSNIGGGVEELTTRVDMLEDIVVGTSVVDTLPMISAPLPGDGAATGGIYQNTIFFLRTPGEEDPMYPGIPTYTYSAHVGIDMVWVALGGGSGSSPSTGGVSIKGRVETKDMLPITENVNGDIWLVGSHLDPELQKFIYIAEFSRFEQLGGSIVPSGGFIKVDVLPTTDIDVTKIYLVPKVAEGVEVENTLDEYINVDGVWELIGTRQIDISGLATTEALDAVDTRLTEVELELLELDVNESITNALDIVFSGMGGENMLPTFAVTPSHLSGADQSKLYDKNNTTPVSLAPGNGSYAFSVVRDPSVSRYTQIELRYLNTTANANLSCTAYMTKEDYDNKENGITVIDNVRVNGSTDIQIFEIPEANQTAYCLVNILSISHGGGYPLQCAYIGVYHKSYDLPISESVREDIERINNELEFVDKIDFTSPTLTSNDSSNVFKITAEHDDVWKLFDGDSTSTLHFMSPVTFDVTLQTPMILKSYKFSSILKANVNYSATSLVITDANTDTNIHSLPLNGSETVAKNINLSDNVIASDKYRFVITGHSNGYPGSAADTLDLNFEIDYNGSKTIYDINSRIDVLESIEAPETPIASDVQPGVIKVGDDLAITEDGTLSVPSIPDINNALEFVNEVPYEYPILTANDSSNKLLIEAENADVWKLFDRNNTTKVSFYSNLVFDVILEKPCILKAYKFVSASVSGVNFPAKGLTITDKHSGTVIDTMSAQALTNVDKDLPDNTVVSDRYTVTINWSGVGSHPTRADTLDLDFRIDYAGSKTIYDINERINTIALSGASIITDTETGENTLVFRL